MKLIFKTVVAFVLTATSHGLTAQASSPFNKYVELTGSNRIELAHLPLTTSTLPGAKLTVEAWIKTSQASFGTIIGWKGVNGMMLRIVDGKLEWGEDIGSWNKAVSVPTVNDGTWKHVAVVRDSSFVAMYVDGEAIELTYFSGNSLHNSPAISSTSTIIGAMTSAGAESFIGNIDEVRVWNVARTTAQIKQSKNGPVSVDSEGLIGYYTFDNQDGTNAAVNAPGTTVSVAGVNTIFETAKFSKGATFQGPPSPYVPCVNFKLPIDGFTVEAWVKSTNNSGSRTIVGFRNNVADQGIMLRIQNGYIQWGEWDGFWGNIMGTSTVIPTDGTWAHVAVVRAANGVDSKLYINGVLEPSTTPNLKQRTAIVNTTTVTIGNIMPGSGEYFNGSIDEVRVWKGERTAAQLVESMSMELNELKPDLLAHYKLEADGKNEVAIEAEYPKNVGDPLFLTHNEGTIVTSLARQTGEGLKVSVHNRIIRVEGVETIQVYSVAGHQLPANVPLKSGIYIVKANNRMLKIQLQ